MSKIIHFFVDMPSFQLYAVFTEGEDVI